MSSRSLFLAILLFCVAAEGVVRLAQQQVERVQEGLSAWLSSAWSAITSPQSRINPNAPPPVDPTCIARLQARPGVTIRPAAAFTRQEACVVEGAVHVDQLAGLRLRSASPLMRCEVAEQLDAWLREAVIPESQRLLRSPVVGVGHIGTYNCRTIRGNSSILSQHSFANAVDIAWVDLADGRRLRLIDGWTSAQAEISEFWHKIQELSCNYFHVSLGPNFNAAHRDHFHFDLGPFRSCR